MMPKNQSTEVLNRWRIPGQITDMPRAVATTDNLKASTRFIEDGSFVRLKTVTLSYNFAGGLLKKWGKQITTLCNSPEPVHNYQAIPVSTPK